MGTDKSGWVVGKVLAEHAAVRGEKPFLQFQDDPPLTFHETDLLTTRLANGLLRHDVEPGERVGVMLPNSIEICITWFALSRLGAVTVFVNTAYKGSFLTHVLTNSGVRIIFIHADYLPWLAEIEEQAPQLEKAFVLGGEGEWPAMKRVELVSYEALALSPNTEIEREVRYSDIGAIMFTSGTTGPSKGVLMPHAHLYLLGLGVVENLEMNAGDTYYICMPLFHANALLIQLYGSLIAGCSVVIVPGFSASRWLDDIRNYGITITNTLGVMTEFVYRQPQRPEDGDNRLRVIYAVPAPLEIREAFEHRFALRLIEAYGMTEINMVLYHSMDEPYHPGSCGKPYSKFFEVRVVDPETDEELPPGEVGEIVARPKEPFCFMQGYNAMDGKTVETWRNLWFHTGDAGRTDEDGYFYFVDRINDYIRVRGENISSYEIENVLSEFEHVAESAAIAVKSEFAGGEDEVKVCIVLKEGASPTPEEVLDHCQERMPYFAVPRYVEFVGALPKTLTEKVQKAKLRAAGITPDTWDRKAVGYQVRKGA